MGHTRDLRHRPLSPELRPWRGLRTSTGSSKDQSGDGVVGRAGIRRDSL